MEILRENTIIRDQLPLNNGCLPNELPNQPSAFENMSSVRHATFMHSHTANSSKVVKPKLIQRSKPQVNAMYQVSWSMNHCPNPADNLTQTIIHHRVQGELGEHQGSVSVLGAKQEFRSILYPQVKAEIALARAGGVWP